MKVTLRKSRVSVAMLNQLEAAGITVVLIMTSVTCNASDFPEVVRGDLVRAIVEAQAEQVAAALALKLAPVTQTQTATVVADTE